MHLYIVNPRTHQDKRTPSDLLQLRHWTVVTTDAGVGRGCCRLGCRGAGVGHAVEVGERQGGLIQWRVVQRQRGEIVSGRRAARRRRRGRICSTSPYPNERAAMAFLDQGRVQMPKMAARIGNCCYSVPVGTM
jgi:hypothetical protein